MNILGVDFGTKKIGLAWVQEAMGVVLPYGLIEGDNKVADLAQLIKDEKIDLVVFGLPKNTDDDSGEETKNEKRVKAFAKELESEVSVKITFADESFSSAEADAMEGEASRDEKSAMVILQEYLASKK
jgi:putative holliday junction resolvase